MRKDSKYPALEKLYRKSPALFRKLLEKNSSIALEKLEVMVAARRGLRHMLLSSIDLPRRRKRKKGGE